MATKTQTPQPESINDVLDRMQAFIKPLNLNGLHGRVLRIPAASKTTRREILMVYGHHSSLERMFGVAEAFADYGNVTMPDMPGFGGMDSFYGIGMKPTIDDLADYLATFVKLRYRTKKITIIGMSLGLVVATRMLQRYPALQKRVELIVSLVGFSHKDDFSFSRPRQALYTSLTYIVSHKLIARVFYHTALQPWVIRTAYARTHNAKHKFTGMDETEKRQMLDFEVRLWRENDAQTHAYTNYQLFKFDNTKSQIDLPLHHVTAEVDQYFDKHAVEQHFRIIFSDYIEYVVDAKVHAPSVVANKSEAEMYIPDTLKKTLKKRPRQSRKA